MGVVWVHWLMARGQILKESLGLLATPYQRPESRSTRVVASAPCTFLSVIFLMYPMNRPESERHFCGFVHLKQLFLQ